MVRVPPGEWIDSQEAADLLSVSRRRVQALAKTNRVRTLNVAGRLLIDRKSALAWQAAKRTGRPPKPR